MKKGILRLLGIIGDFFTGLFNAAQRTWKKLSPELQKAMLQGSEIINLINKNVDQAPDFVIEAILAKFPDLTREKLHEMLQKASEELSVYNQINNEDLETTISALQQYLSKLQGKTWANISQTLAKAIAAFTAPPETKFATISALIEYVYHAFIKKDK